MDVFVDEDFLDLAQMYIVSKKKEISVYNQALENQDFESLKNMAHKMKGTGGSYGFHFLTEVGAKIEDLSIEKNKDAIGFLIKDIEDYLNKVNILVK